MLDRGRAASGLSRGLLGAFVLFVPLVAVTALAWACNPQAHIALDKSVYEAGSTITVHGSYFVGDASVTVTGPTGSTTVQTSPDGLFTTQLTAPASPGSYTITASRPTGGFAPASFTVVEGPPQPPADPPGVPSVPGLPSPALVPEPDLRGPTIVRPVRSGETVRVARNGSFRLFCGRFEESSVEGTCAAASLRRARAREAPLLELSAKPFHAQPGRHVRLRFYLTPAMFGRVRAATVIRMRGTVVARDRLGNRTTRSFDFGLRAPAAPKASAR